MRSSLSDLRRFRERCRGHRILFGLCTARCTAHGDSAGCFLVLISSQTPGGFNLAVHVMPQNISLMVYVSAGGLGEMCRASCSGHALPTLWSFTWLEGWWPRWHAAREVDSYDHPDSRMATSRTVSGTVSPPSEPETLIKP